MFPTLSVTIIGLVVGAIALAARGGGLMTLGKALAGAWIGFAIGALVGVAVDAAFGTGIWVAYVGHGFALVGAVASTRTRRGQADSLRNIRVP